MRYDIFLTLCQSLLNLPYISGGKNPLQGEDCSGLACEILKACGKIGTNDEYNAQELYNLYRGSPLTLRGPGALVWYGSSINTIVHVAICLDDTFIIEAGHGTADTLTKEEAMAQGSYVRIRPHNYRSDWVATINLDIVKEII